VDGTKIHIHETADKMPAYEEIRRKADVSDSAVAYIGDDLPDIPFMRVQASQLSWTMPAPR